jgi:uncharacterized protein YebE (UPF0316 family)
MLTVIGTCILIFVARIGDVGLGTLRLSMVIQGRRGPAWVVGFFESLIWTLAAAKVLSSIHENYWFTVAYAAGFATGGYVGMSVERWLAFGSQVIRIMTRTPLVEYGLRTAGVAVTRFDGHGRDGPVMLLMVVARRGEVQSLLEKVHELDTQCYYMIEDVRQAKHIHTFAQSTEWRAATSRK